MKVIRVGSRLSVVALLTMLSACAVPSLPFGLLQPAQPIPPQLLPFYQQRLQWQDCDLGQCSYLTVPLDYGHPTGATLRIAVFRAPSTDRTHRIGSLVLNPGGPGAPGIPFARDATTVFPEELRQRFDLVGFDPRGVGQSAPIRCLTDSQLDAYTQLPAYPANAAEQAQLVSAAQELARTCQQHSGSELQHLSTADEARDMDVLRAALGDSKLTFYGASYGTFLGTLYAELFPTRVRALVLDSAIDPARSGPTDDVEQAQSFEHVLQLFISFCVRSGNCPLGGSMAEANHRLDQLMAQVAKQPLPGSNGRVVGSGPLLAALAYGMYDPTVGFPQLMAALGDGLNGNGAGLLRLADQLNARDADGHYENLIVANMAINCVDRPRPRSLGDYAGAASRAAAVAPHFGAANVWGELSCAFWPVQAQLKPAPARDSGAPPVLVLASRGDPATPYQWSYSLAHELQGGVLLTLEAAMHGVFAVGADCIDQPTVAYLTTLALPPPGVCRPG
jgi:pimeloyl-ACP methyl ester carboxylesterase